MDLLAPFPIAGDVGSGSGEVGVNGGSLFSGIGGFDEGFRRAGISTSWQVEIDPDCQRVLAHHFGSGVQLERGPRTGGAGGSVTNAEDRIGPRHPERTGSAVIHSDVTAVGRHNLAAVDVVCGGFPCQDLSVAGERAGLAGDRSGLWFEFHRILAELAPRWVVIENVPGLLSSNGGADMAVVLGGLAELGYGWAYRVLDAQYFGVAQRRRRVFIVGCLGDSAAAAQVLFEPESCDGDSPPSRAPRERVAAGLTAGSHPGSNEPGRRREDDVNLAITLTSGSGGGRYDKQPRWPIRSGLRGTSRTARTSTPMVATVGALTASQDNGSTGNAQVESGQIIVAHTLKAEGHDASEDGTGRGVPLTVAPAMTAFNMDSRPPQSEEQQRTVGAVYEVSAAVRRLTPTECERLQGFPDGWTDVDGMADSPRYRMLGNAVAAPVAEWIGRRIVAYEEV